MESFYSFVKKIDNDISELGIMRKNIQVGSVNYGRIGGRSSSFSSGIEEAAIKREKITDEMFKLMDLRFLVMNIIVDYGYKIKDTAPAQIVRGRIKGLKKQEILKKYKIPKKNYEKYETDCINYIREILVKRKVYF